MCFTVQLSKIIFRIAVCLKQLCYYIMLFSACQEVFSTFFEVVFVSLLQQLWQFIISTVPLSRTFFATFRLSPNGEGGIWTLAPLLTTYSLSRGAPSATWVLLQMPDQKISFFFCNGEGGIRTHAPFRTNGFQDRLVMTTSIPLHIFVVVCAFVSLEDKWYSIICFPICQYTFFIFLLFFTKYFTGKYFADFEVFRRCDFYILIRPFIEPYPMISIGFYYHGIIGNSAAVMR